jgi:hypothetical protein
LMLPKRTYQSSPNASVSRSDPNRSEPAMRQYPCVPTLGSGHANRSMSRRPAAQSPSREALHHSTIRDDDDRSDCNRVWNRPYYACINRAPHCRRRANPLRTGLFPRLRRSCSPNMKLSHEVSSGSAGPLRG